MFGTTRSTSSRRRTAVALVGILTLVGSLLMVATATQAAEEPTPRFKLGGEQQVLGPAHYVDSVYASVMGNDGHRYAYLSNETSYMFQASRNGTLWSSRPIMSVGPRGSIDHCGVHPVGGIFKTTRTHWVTYYHAERANPHQYGGACYGSTGGRNKTRWSIIRMDSFDAGKTWRKGGEVLNQDGYYRRTWPSAAYSNQDDAGSPRMVVQGNFLYLFYRAVNRQSPRKMQMSVARAPKTRPSDFRKYKYVEGRWSNPANWKQKGIGGQQSGLPGLHPTARGIAWNTYLDRYVSVMVSRAGIKLYGSRGRDLAHWTHLKDLKGSYNIPSAWGQKCVPGKTPDFPMALGYGAAVGWNGDSQSTGQNFWVYYMLKPKGKCFSERYLVRRQVAIDRDFLATPKLSYVPRFGPVRKVGNGHGWNITTSVFHNSVPAMGRLVHVQVWTSGRWVTRSYLRSNQWGTIKLTGYASGKHRFYAPKTGPWPGITSTAFYRKYRG